MTTNQQLTQELFQYASTTTGQAWNIAKWLSSRGRQITAYDLERHPQIDHVIDLLNIRQALWHMMDNREQGVWAAYWNIVYNKKKPLNEKFWQKFDRIAQSIQQRQLKQSAIRQLIQSVRQQ
jgi:hypothetical protein